MTDAITPDTQARFDRACDDVKALTNVTNDDKGVLYGLFKQATLGDNAQPRPPFNVFDMLSAAKWNAWEARRGTSREQAAAQYAEFVQSKRLAAAEE